MQFSIEDLETGRFAHVAWVHGGLLDFRAASDERDDLYNRVGDAFVAIHLWSADSDVGKQVVLPFVKEFEPRLLNGDLTASLDPLNYNSQQLPSTGSASTAGTAGLASITGSAASKEGLADKSELTQPRLTQQDTTSDTEIAAGNRAAAAGNILGNVQAALGTTGDTTGSRNAVAGATSDGTSLRDTAAGVAIDRQSHRDTVAGTQSLGARIGDAAVNARIAAAAGNADAATGGTSQVAGSARTRRRRRADTQSV